jgi:hypothetical protein
MRYCLVPLLLTISAFAQKPETFHPSRLADGRPDLQGVWRNASIVAAFNVEGQSASYAGPEGKGQLQRGSSRSRPRGPLPHHGAPRSLVPPFPIEFVQDTDYLVLLSETEHSIRIIPLHGGPHLKNAGDSRGRWERDTLVVDVTGFNGKTWLDQAGNFVDENEHVVERFTMTGPDTILYEARVDDPTVYSRPWTLRVPLRPQPKGTELIGIEGERDEVHYPGGRR